jgi:hypothetical protein
LTAPTHWVFDLSKLETKESTLAGGSPLDVLRGGAFSDPVVGISSRGARRRPRRRPRWRCCGCGADAGGLDLGCSEGLLRRAAAAAAATQARMAPARGAFEPLAGWPAVRRIAAQLRHSWGRFSDAWRVWRATVGGPAVASVCVRRCLLAAPRVCKSTCACQQRNIVQSTEYGQSVVVVTEAKKIKQGRPDGKGAGALGARHARMATQGAELASCASKGAAGLMQSRSIQGRPGSPAREKKITEGRWAV